MLTRLRFDSLWFDDFTTNGVLLPGTESMARRIGGPLHRGPHREYNDLVITRVGQIAGDWDRQRSADPSAADGHAWMRLSLLQKALRRRLLRPRTASIRLNRNDPVGRGTDFSHLDQMAETLWGDTTGLASA